MEKATVVVTLIFVILASSTAGYLLGASTVKAPTSKTTITTTSCTVLGPTIGVVIRVVEGGLYGNPPTPIEGARVDGKAAGYCNNALQTQALQPTVTNSSGWAPLLDGGFGVYDLNVTYGVGNPQLTEAYHLSISMQPTTVTYVVFNTTTGNVTTHLCEYNIHCYVGN